MSLTSLHPLCSWRGRHPECLHDEGHPGAAAAGDLEPAVPVRHPGRACPDHPHHLEAAAEPSPGSVHGEGQTRRLSPGGLRVISILVWDGAKGNDGLVEMILKALDS